MDEKEVIEELAEEVSEADEITEEETHEEETYEEEIEETAEEVEESEEDDFDFEYDEEGNIVIPDDEEESAGDEEEKGKKSSAAKKAATADKEEAKEVAAKADPRDKEISDLRKKLARLERLGKDAMKAMGSDAEDVELGLAGIAAESQGGNAKDHLDKVKNEEAAAEVKAQIARARFEQIAAADLAELHAAYPETKQYKHVGDMPIEILKKFGKARDAGFSAKEAYAAANPDGIRTNATVAGKKAAMHNSKAHLTSNVPKMSKDTGAKLTRAELAEFRETFPNLTDKEIIKLYKSVN